MPQSFTNLSTKAQSYTQSWPTCSKKGYNYSKNETVFPFHFSLRFITFYKMKRRQNGLGLMNMTQITMQRRYGDQRSSCQRPFPSLRKLMRSRPNIFHSLDHTCAILGKWVKVLILDESAASQAGPKQQTNWLKPGHCWQQTTRFQPAFCCFCPVWEAVNLLQIYVNWRICPEYDIHALDITLQIPVDGNLRKRAAGAVLRW